MTAPTSTPELQVGDVVRVGRGKTDWRVTGFGAYSNGHPYVCLEAVAGYSRQSVEPGRVTRIDAS